MNKIRWGRVFLVILAIVAISRWRDVCEFWSSLRLGEMLQEYIAHVWEMPPPGRALILLALFALGFVTVFVLVREKVRRSSRPEPPGKAAPLPRPTTPRSRPPAGPPPSSGVTP